MAAKGTSVPSLPRALDRAAESAPPISWFVISAIFHYLGPSFAVLLFPAVGVLGVAWLRVISAAVLLASVARPWRTFEKCTWKERRLLLALGACLAIMNTSFYLALDELPMSLVAAMEFAGTVAVALYGLRTGRNLLALALAVAGVFLLIDVKWAADPLGLFWSVLNAVLFATYIVLGHRTAQFGASSGVERLAAAMAIAGVIIMPIGFGEAIQAAARIDLLLAGVAVGVCSSVIPYVADQMAMSRMPRATFALFMALLPATATAIAAVVLDQIPSVRDAAGVMLVMSGVALHKPAAPISACRRQLHRATTEPAEPACRMRRFRTRP